MRDCLASCAFLTVLGLCGFGVVVLAFRAVFRALGLL